MRHGKKFNHLGRKAPHRKAMLSNMATSLILQKRITTTVAKAKALRKYVEPLITKSKEDTTHSRRVVFSYLQNNEGVSVLFDEVAEKVASRPGGYTRIIKTGSRLGDNAEMCLIELVDYNEIYTQESGTGKAKKKTRRRSKKAAPKAEAAPAAEVVEEAPAEVKETPEATVETESAAEVVAEEPKVEELKAETEEEVKAEAEAPEASEEEKKEDKKEDDKEDSKE